ncbi:MAG: DnaJ domain-containing protein [Coriobacteriia bacterium]|nr:DnaJ domain-containing protein [Coriobacteriia bacterium]
MFADHYRVLQVARDADPAVIDKAYRVLALKYHPDTSAEAEETANHRMRRINDAYVVLGDPVKRAHYDATLHPERGTRNGWDVFWEEGLVGLYLNRRDRR